MESNQFSHINRINKGKLAMLELRPYQADSVDKIIHEFSQPCSVLGVAATGAGKTVILLEATQRILRQSPAHRVLIVAHRRALIEQPMERIGQFWPNMVRDAGIVMANKNQAKKRLIIASVQTLANEKRMNQILSHGAITHVIIDEAHRAGAQTYLDVIECCKTYRAAVRLLGVTATPERADGTLADVFTHEVFRYGTSELIEMGWLVRPEVRGVMTQISTADVQVQGSGKNRDFNKSQLANVFETDNCFDLVVESHKQYAAGRPGIAFTVSVAGAYALADRFTAAGIPAVAVDGTTHADDERDAISGMKSGKYQMLVNCMKFIEGFDLPMLEVCHLVRPLRQDGPWIQCVGRVLRLAEGKESALVLDYLPQERSLELSLHKRASRIGAKNITKSVTNDGSSGFGDNPFMDIPPTIGVGSGLEYVVLDYFNNGNGSNKTWIESGDGWRIIGLGEGDDGIQRTLAVSPAAESMQLWAVWKRKGQRWNQAAVLEEGDCDYVLGRSEEIIRKRGAKALTGRSAEWRERAPSDKMADYGRNLRVYRPDMTGGELSDAINEKLAMQALRRAGAI